ncbi:MAG: IclR family transcriptional regulator [Geodermatophilaceae bacterium]
MSSPASGTQAVDRAALLVATVVRADEPVSFAALAEECGLPKSTASRLLTALERTELVERRDTGSYVAGPLFDLYAARHDPWEELARLARPVLATIGEETGETVNLGVPRGGRVTHIAQVDARYLLGTRDWTLVDVPPHASALGKVLYAFGAIEAPHGELAAVTPHTETNPDRFARHLASVRRRGYASTVDELELGLTGVAVPVRDREGQVVAALGISGPTARLAERLAPTGALLIAQSERLTSLQGKVGAA